MATEFEQLLQEQKLTNKLLTEKAAADAKSPSIARSFRNSLGEIIDNRRTTKKYADEDKKFQKKEGIVKVDENVAAGTKEVLTQSKFFKEQINSLDTQDDLLYDMAGSAAANVAGIRAMVTMLNEMVKIQGIQYADDKHQNQISAAYRRRVISNVPPPSKTKANEKKETSNEKKSQGLLKGILDSGKGLIKFMESNKYAQAAGGFIKKALLIGGLIGFIKFISSPKFLEFARFLDKTVVPALGKIFNFLKSVGEKIGKMALTLIDPDATTQQKIISGIGLIAIAGLAIFSKTIALYTAGMGLAALLALSKITLAAFFSPIGLFALAGLGAYLVHDDAKKFAKEQYEKDGKKPLSLIRGYITGSLGGMAEGIDKFFIDVMKVFGVERKKTDYKNKLNDYFKEMADNVVNFFTEDIPKTFMRMINSIKRFFMGSTQEDVEGDIEFRNERIEKRQKKIEEAEEKGLAKVYINRLKAFRDHDIDMKNKLQGQLSEMQDKDIRRTSGFIPFMQRTGPVGPVDNSSGMKGFSGAYKGGRVGQGQSILVGEMGPELMIPRTDAQVFSARRTEEMIMAALARGMNGGGEGGSTIITSDNSVRSNSSTTNVVNETITPLDTITTSVVSSV